MPLFDLFWAILWFFLFVVWIWLLITVFADMFRSDLSGWKKALWTVFLIVLPVIGVLVYLIAHGSKMQERTLDRAVAMEQQQRDYIKRAAGTASTADEIAKLADLHSRGVITDAEFNTQKAALLGGQSTAEPQERKHAHPTP